MKYDKEYKNTLPSKYYRDFPEEYGPEIVGYLLHKQISTNDLSASILNLIYKKAIAFEPCEKKDYKFINLHNQNITVTEQKLMDWLFHDQDEVTLKKLKKSAENSYSQFLEKYNAWKSSALVEGKNYQFYESSMKQKIWSSLYSIVGFILGSIIISKSYVHYIYAFLGIFLLIFAFCSLVYFISYQKRSPFGNESYCKWIALKNFMVDFGNMGEKELPEIALWEKYLVYAVTLGCAKKLAKKMEIKVRELEEMNLDTTILDFHRMHVWLSFHQTLSESVISAINTANSVKIANSSRSSSGGFGGGFSGGGGSFGGGGGGGRF